MINTTFTNEDKGKLGSKNSTQKGDYKFIEKPHKTKKGLTSTKQDGLMNLYSKAKKSMIYQGNF